MGSSITRRTGYFSSQRTSGPSSTQIPWASDLLACASDRLPGMDFPALWQDPGTMDAFRKKIGEGQGVAGLEGRVSCKDGRVKDVLISAGVLPDGKIACSVADITDRIEAAKAVERERQELLDIIEFLPDATFVIDREKRVIAWNRAIEAMTGLPKAEILGMGDYAYALPFYSERRPILIDLIFEGDPGIEARYEWIKREGAIVYGEIFIPRLRNGLGAHLWVKASPLLDRDGNIAGAIETIRDITERRMSEEVLRESEMNYRTVFNGANDAILIYDLEDRCFTEVNRKALEMFGYGQEELAAMSFEDLTSGDPPFTRMDALKKFALVREDLMQGKPLLIEWMARDKSGRAFWVEMNLKKASIWGETRILAVVRDITARKASENALRASEANYRAVFNAASEGIFVIDPVTYRILDTNTKGSEMLGYSREELLGMDINVLSDTEHGYTHLNGREWLEKEVSDRPRLFEWRSRAKSGQALLGGG